VREGTGKTKNRGEDEEIRRIEERTREYDRQKVYISRERKGKYCTLHLNYLSYIPMHCLLPDEKV
jgi:hypothetical protein